MADKARLEHLAAAIQQAVTSYDPNNPSSWIPIQDAMEKPRRATEPPAVFIMKQRFHTIQNICLVAALEMGLLQTLAAKKGENLTASNLALESGYDKVSIARIMRMMAAIGFADETGYQTYTTNPVTIRQSDPESMGGVVLTNEMTYPLVSKIREYLRQNKPCDITQTPPPYDFAMGDSVWETFTKNVVWKKGFDDSMTARNKTLSIPWHVKFPVQERLAERKSSTPPIIVDIGGNQGVDLNRFIQHFPNLEYHAKAMKPHSRLLINEIRDDMDMLMLFLSNGMERTKTQWTELLAKVEPPLQLVEIWSVPVDQQSVLESCLA
ncbi:hypothetical protein BO78DRAFT_456840 [Aspergillus sclerotiicarbonarius CBS 121057]|uniref:S-adenosyl-L-methionine-dependent methyltransferase n=1 Tax=Aspergillus sclerotiicarbonarius (strain CBS 121057 / IBT 28362) TaxID=1448318 RepID=A0A319EVD5_ASPSB|nr:hypothetical protein BO78DRAFT_456840 [Aspergillus sclerotiicarbonarius CBS 121057]